MPALKALSSRSSPTPARPSPRDAAHGLYARHAGKILGFCIRRLNTREEAEDAVQTVFVNALRALQRGVVPISEEAWLFKIAENVCHETHRANFRRRQREVAELGELPDPVAPEAEPGKDVATELMAVLSDLPVNQRRALLLREWRGFSYREIATELRCSVGAVETLIFRARRNVAQALSQTRAGIASILDLGSLVGGLKTAFGGATTANIAAAAAVATVAALPAGGAPAAPAAKRADGPTRVTPRADRNAPAAAKTVSHGERHIARGRIAVGTASESSTEPRPERDAPQAPSPRAIPPAAPAIVPPRVRAAPAVQLPRVPRAPRLPQMPQVPQLPELPTEVPLPQAPVELPVQPPDIVELPPLP